MLRRGRGSFAIVRSRVRSCAAAPTWVRTKTRKLTPCSAPRIPGTIANAVQEQSAATQEISHNVRQTAAGTQKVVTNITSVKDSAASTGQTATQLMTAAASLKDQSQALSAEVEGFLKTVRAA